MASTLKLNRTLEYLVLTDNYINDEGGRHILSAIQNNGFIKEISLESNLLGYKIYNALVEHLKQNKNKQLVSKYPMKK